MDLPDFLDPTTLCVVLLVLALCLLWAYVMLYTGKQEPNFSILYDQDFSGPKASKKQSKGKSKKQGDVSPRVPAKPREVPAVSGSTSAAPAAKKLKPQPVSAASKTIQNVGSEVRSRKVQVTPSKGAEEEMIKDQPEGNEGEWQMQYSRQQLRALRQKRQQEADKAGSSSDSELIKSEKNATIDESKSAPSAPATVERVNSGKNVRKTKEKKQRGEAQKNAWKSSERVNGAASKDTSKTGAGDEQVESVPNLSTAIELPSVDQRLSTPPVESQDQGLTEVEKALQEAAESSSPTPEFEEESKKVNPKRRKKPKRKSPSPDPAAEEYDDWLVIETPKAST